MTQDQKDKLIEAFESIVLPMIPSDWPYGNDLTIYLDYSPGECGGWSIGTGPIGRNHEDYKSIEKVFRPLLLEISHLSRDELNISSGYYLVRYNRDTKVITERCRWYTEVIAYSLN